MSLATFVLAAALNPGGLIAWLFIGLVAGWLAGVIMPGKGFGLLGDLIIGLVGFSTSTGVYSVQAGGLRQLRQERPWRAGQRLARFVFPFRGG